MLTCPSDISSINTAYTASDKALRKLLVLRHWAPRTIDWQFKPLVSSQVPACWRRCLLDRGSLTARLLAASGGDFRVEVLRQQVGRAQLAESRLLGLPPGRRAIIREVLLHGRDTPWVYARSILPMSTLTGRQRRLKRLDNRPLGALLFADPGMRRGTLQVGRVAAASLPLAGSVSEDPEPLWGRRSVFLLDGKPLLVSEIFLPDFSPYNEFCLQKSRWVDS